MAPFLVRHPVLIHHWFAAREEALARKVRSQPNLTFGKLAQFVSFPQGGTEKCDAVAE